MAVLTLDDLKHRLQELKTLHASGALSAEAYASARAPLERQLVEQVLAQGGPAAAPRAPRKLVAAVAAFVVVVGVGGYLWKGQPQAWDVGPGSATAAADASAADGGSQEMTPQQLAQLTERLAKRLQQEPDNADGWVMLARSYALLSRYGDALAAYQRYTALRPGDAQAWADEADVVAMMQGRSLDGEPAPLTYKEFELLQFLVLREGRTVDRSAIIDGLWSDGEDETPNERTIDVHVRRLRSKLGAFEEIVRTVRGVGYRFDRHADVAVRYASTPSPDLF